MRFARLVRKRYPSARLYLFGSRARGTVERYSDFDVVIVSPGFAGQKSFERPVNLYELWRTASDYIVSIDLHCYTPEEFRRQVRGLGFLGSAKRRGELIPMKTTARGGNATVNSRS